MTGDVASRDLMLEQQGRRVFVAKADGSGKTWALTIVHVIDTGDRRELRLVNRDSKDRKPDWLLAQKLWDAIQPFGAESNKLNCQYQLTIR